MLFDSHCHLTDERLIEDADEVVARAHEGGVTRMVTIGAEPEGWDDVVALAARLAGVWAAIGVHPHVADLTDDAVLERAEELAAREEVVAIGETGLDYYYENAPRDAQRRSFLRHIELAGRLGLPVIVHSRSADADTAAVLRDVGRSVRGVLHCFDGGRDLLDAGLDAGWYISFSGLVTFKNYEGAELVRAVPADRLLIETDSPYLAPVPKRGRRNEPALVRHVAEGVARLRGESFEEIAAVTASNASCFYDLPAPT